MFIPEEIHSEMPFKQYIKTLIISLLSKNIPARLGKINPTLTILNYMDDYGGFSV